MKRIKNSAENQSAAQKILIKGATIISMDDAIGNFEKGDILVNGTKIEAIGQNLNADGATVINAHGMIAIPGFIDAHRHAWQGSLRRLMPNVQNLTDYVSDIHFAFAKHYRPQDMYTGTLLNMISCIDSGVTTVIDASHNARTAAHSEASIDALEDAGIRALYAPGKPLTGDWANHWPQDLGRLQKERFQSEDQLVQLAMFSQPDRENWRVARELGLPIITEMLGAEMSELLPVYQKEGLLGSDNIFNHVTGLTDQAWEIIKESEVKVIIDPRSDAQYALEEGVFPYDRAIEKGLKPALGTDLESAYGGDMFTEMRVAFSLQRAFGQNKRYNGAQHAHHMTVKDILTSATVNGAIVAGLEDKAGSLTPGKEADIVLLKADDLNIYPALNAIGAVVHAADRSNVDTVIIGGRVMKSQGKLLGVNQDQLKALVDESIDYLFQAEGYQADIFAEEYVPTAQSNGFWTAV
ncbi:amidohydrolase [Pedobacter sp. HMWF019]|uniref:amidohydrolase family protein n=1 Tax=Pedobacter sp. HMWF019 TaxID=2056856 RepID=UPI000D3C7DBC|nr:amidohydrolase family protein [Pedobacter sp. HMWF019]PTT01858.1 amidohydrolase [Pedobacter sp. HMWF019]